MFSHEKLHVYQETLHFVARAEDIISAWDRKHAVVDHLSRAAESVLVNLAEACRVPAGAARILGD
jgi:hypothetical protein